VETGRDALDASLDFSYEKLRLRTGYKLRDNQSSGAGVGSALDPVGKGRSERLTTDLSWTDPVFAKSWSVGVQGSYFEYKDTVPQAFQLLPPNTRIGPNLFPVGLIAAPEKWERQVRLSVFAVFTGLEGHRLRLGGGYDDLNLYKIEEHKNFRLSPNGVPIPVGSVISFTDTEPFMTPQRRKISYVVVQDEWQFMRDWALTAGVRHDHYSDFGGTTNPRLALVWDARLDVVVKLLAGRAFRAPSFAELYSINNPVSRGNPALRPETISTLEAATSWQVRRDLQVGLNLFRYQMKDIIRLAGSPATYSNTSDQRGSGLELELGWEASRALKLIANYSYQRSIDAATGRDAGYAPRHHLFTRADWQLAGGMLASAQLNHVADRHRAAGDTRAEVPNYTTVDLSLRVPVASGRWMFSAAVRNLFDADVRQPSLYSPAARQDLPTSQLPDDLPMAGRSFQLQASYRF
jgi:iron complex outermembrane receptor protein